MAVCDSVFQGEGVTVGGLVNDVDSGGSGEDEFHIDSVVGSEEVVGSDLG